MNKNRSIQTIVAIGIGAAIFVVLSRFASIPTGIPNTSLETSYAVLALIALLYGPLAGFATGLIGHFLKDVLIFGSPWMSWIIASAMIGRVIGLISKSINIDNFNSIAISLSDKKVKYAKNHITFINRLTKNFI